MKEKEKRGSITVFLSLILLLILAVAMTTIEAARVNGAKVYTERALQSAMDSVLGEYYLPLFQEYHLFGLDSGYGTDNMALDTVTSKMTDYMEYTFNPGKGLKTPGGSPYEYFDLYGINISHVNINRVNTLKDFDGKLFINQAVSYMKYKEVGEKLESFLPKLSDTLDTKTVQEVLLKKQETADSLYEVDKRILSLMQLIDGITISEKGVKVNGDGKIAVQDDFVKKIFVLPVSMTNTGVQNELAFNSLSSHYINPGQMIASAMADMDSLNKNALKKDSADETYQRLKSVDQSRIKSSQELDALKQSITKAKKKLDGYKQTEKSLLKSLNKYMKTLDNLVEDTLPVIRNAQTTADDLIRMQEAAGTKIQAYENFLSGNKELFSEEFYQGLLEDLSSMVKYKGFGSDGGNSNIEYDFKGMRDTLSMDENILVSLKQDTRMRVTADKESWITLKEALVNIKSNISGYSYEKLQFDYSTLVRPVESDSFFSGIKSLLEDGIMGLIIQDTEEISGKVLRSAALPSAVQKIPSGEEPADLISSVVKINLLGGGDLLSGILGDFGKNIDFKEAVLSKAEGAGNFLLLQEYLLEHFCSLSDPGLSDEMKALDYELEYIVMGKSSDYGNLKAVLMRILFIRTVMNMITLLSDKKSREEARALAIGFVGFTNLPALVEITKMIIITVWAFAESLVDISALIQGKTLPFLKKGSDIRIGLSELFYINKDLIDSKADAIKEDKTLSELSYQDYLKLFLYMESQENKSFRAMDLIQENIRLKYEDTFSVVNCILGFQADAEFKMDSRFIKLPFIKQMLNKKDNGYFFRTVMEYAY